MVKFYEIWRERPYKPDDVKELPWWWDDPSALNMPKWLEGYKDYDKEDLASE